VKRAAPLALVLVLAGPPAVCAAEAERGPVDLGLTLHALEPLGEACETEDDTVSCSVSVPFVGARMSAHFWPVDVLGVGLGVALSKDVDGSGGASDDGLTWDPTDMWLWRFTAELIVDPPLLPSGLWAGLDVGLVVLREVKELHEGAGIEQLSASRSAPLFGLALGWDFWVEDALTLTPELRVQVIRLGEPPELRPGIEGRDFGTTTLIELGVRVAAVP